MAGRTKSNAEPKPAKELAYPNTRQRENSEENWKKMIQNKHQAVTKAIRNAGKVLNMSIIEINKVSGKLKNNRFKIPHYA